MLRRFSMSRRQCHRSSALCQSCVRRPSQQDSVNVTSPVGREEGHGGAVAPCDEQPVDVERVDDEVGVELHDLVDVDQGENERFLGATRVLENSEAKSGLHRDIRFTFKKMRSQGGLRHAGAEAVSQARPLPAEKDVAHLSSR